MKKILAALLLTLPTLAVAVDLEGFYITPKGGTSKSMDTGVANYGELGDTYYFNDEDLGTGYAFGLSAGKYITNNFRIELEAMKRGSYEYDSLLVISPTDGFRGDITSKSLFINSLYDFNGFSLGNRSISPYIGGGIGISRNEMGATDGMNGGVPNGNVLNPNSINQFAYKLSAGTLVGMTESISIDINYQYVNLGSFKSGTVYQTGAIETPLNGGEIKTQELMVGLQYTF